MFKIGQYIMYGHTGMCIIEDIKKGKLMSETESEYYVIKSIYKNNSSTFMVTVNNDKVPMRKIMTREEVDLLISKIPEIETKWIFDDRLRRKKQKELLQSGGTEGLVKLIKSVSIRKNETDKQNKKLSATDNDVFKSATKLLNEEIAFVLGMKVEEISQYINQQIVKTI